MCVCVCVYIGRYRESDRESEMYVLCEVFSPNKGAPNSAFCFGI